MEFLMRLAVPAAGTILIIAAIWRLAGRHDARIADAAHARARLGEDWPRFRAGEVLVARNGRLALILEAGGARVALVEAFGDRLPTRIFAQGEILCAEAKGERLLFAADDATGGRWEMPLPDGADGALWAGRLAALSARDAAA